jgi:hypothetical protein
LHPEKETVTEEKCVPAKLHLRGFSRDSIA